MSTDTAPVFSRKNPFPAPVTVNRRLTLDGSEKDTRHFEISLEGSSFEYEVGDSLGIFPKNDPVLVQQVLEALEFSGEEPVLNPAGETVPIRQALTESYIITAPSKQLLTAIANKDSSAVFLKDMLDPTVKSELDTWLWGRDVLDALREFSAPKFTPEEFVGVLRKLQARLYSIASSQKVAGDSVDLTVALVRYDAHSRARTGVATLYLAERTKEPERVSVFVHSAKHFRLPEDPAADVIMIGPGTGIAPFRAMLQERKVTGAKGRNWLFFGEQRSVTDFLYREELEGFVADGILAQFDTAFSRDQDYKIYVQHRILEHAEQMFEWLEGGAYFYVCGDASRMAKDVDAALHEVVQRVGGKSAEEAVAYVDVLKKAKRYRKDVY